MISSIFSSIVRASSSSISFSYNSSPTTEKENGQQNQLSVEAAILNLSNVWETSFTTAESSDSSPSAALPYLPEVQQQVSSEDDSLASGSADKFTRDYLSFIASMDPDVVSGRVGFAEKVAALQTSMSQSTSSAAEVSVSGDQITASAQATVSAQADVQVTMADGTSVAVSAQVQASASFSVSMTNSGSQQTAQCDPLALDLNQDGKISLSGVDDGVNFDLNADGVNEQAAFVKGGDGFLALDRNKNGVIDDGGELFGDQHGSANGFLELAKFDENQDGMIDAQDSVFADLEVVTMDEKGNFQTMDLDEAGVSAISLSTANVDQAAENGNRVSQIGQYQTASGSWQAAQDVLLNYRS